MRVLITGGAGFIGSNLVRRLLPMSDEVVVLDDLSTGLRTSLQGLPISVHEGSICDDQVVRKAIRNCSHVVHLAARGSVPRSLLNPRATHMVNATGTLNVLEACRETGSYLVFSSSSSVFGSSPAMPKREDVLTAPLTPYGASKLAAEAYVQAYVHSFGLEALVLRFFNVYGPWQRPDHDYAAVIPRWIWNAAHGLDVHVNGDGSVTRDFTYVDDVVNVILESVSRKVVNQTPVNLAFGKSVSLRQVIQLLQESFGTVHVTYGAPRSGDIMHSENDPMLLNALFPSIRPMPFVQGFQSTVRWLRDFGSEVAGGPPVVD
jgi:UDP-glucose 4-epimerase